MRKSGIVMLTFVSVLLILAAFIKPVNPLPTDPPKSIPDSVWSVVQKSCYDCHSSDGNSMAKSKINFDRWAEYSSDKQLNKARDICTQLQKGKMPPSKYRNNNPDAVPTDADVKIICEWTNQISK